jgi:hypothetical protein
MTPNQEELEKQIDDLTYKAFGHQAADGQWLMPKMYFQKADALKQGMRDLLATHAPAALLDRVERDSGLDGLSEPEKLVATKSVTMVSAYEPIEVEDQYGNKYICLNSYEAGAVRDLLYKLWKLNNHNYDTGDWYHDLPVKIEEWEAQQRQKLSQLKEETK